MFLADPLRPDRFAAPASSEANHVVVVLVDQRSRQAELLNHMFEYPGADRRLGHVMHPRPEASDGVVIEVIVKRTPFHPSQRAVEFGTLRKFFFRRNT